MASADNYAVKLVKGAEPITLAQLPADGLDLYEAWVALKPCPFCGGVDEALCHGMVRPTSETQAHYVECRCGVEVWGDTEAEAWTCWNTRTDNDVSGLVEALEQALDTLTKLGWKNWLTNNITAALAKHRQSNGGAA